MSEESRKKNSEAHKGNRYRLGKHHSKETKKKMGEAKKGRHWYNNGEKETFSKECPEGFTPGRLK